MLQTDVLSDNDGTKSAVLFRLLTQTKEASKKRLSESQTHRKKKWKRTIESKKNLYVVQAQYDHRTAADTHLEYQCA